MPWPKTGATHNNALQLGLPDRGRAIVSWDDSPLGLDKQGGRGHWAVYYTSLQSHIIMFSYSLAYQLWVLLLNFDWLAHQVECPNVSTNNYFCNYKERVNLCIIIGDVH